LNSFADLIGLGKRIIYCGTELFHELFQIVIQLQRTLLAGDNDIFMNILRTCV
jgi:hypothetical protein